MIESEWQNERGKRGCERERGCGREESESRRGSERERLERER